MSQFPLHRIGDKRLCGATTISTGKQTKVLVEGKLAAVEGDKNDHNTLGDLISLGGSKVKIQGQSAIAALVDQSAPDQIGIIQHVTGLPTPADGSQKVKIGISLAGQVLGMMGGGRGGSSGNMQQGEPVTIGGQPAGTVYRYVNGGGAGFNVLVLANTNNNVVSGTSVVGSNTGNTFTFTDYYSS